MRIALFCHSLRSDWNHGNAHFLRGLITELAERGMEVTSWEPAGSWSAGNLAASYGANALDGYRESYPRLPVEVYEPRSFDVARALDAVDLAIVHEWTEPALVAAIGCVRRASATLRLLFHDTHHRSVTDPEGMSRFDLANYDGVLAFGESVREQYLLRGWAANAWTFHEAADTRVFYPRCSAIPAGDLVWIGNWGDGERTAELREFLIDPAGHLRLRARVYGVRYPEDAVSALAAAGIEYQGWIPNYQAPEIFSRYRFTVHVPRSPYARALRGVPTIRMFEALACGIPLISAPWEDAEQLFPPGCYLTAKNGTEMRDRMREIAEDDSLAGSLSQRGLAAIRSRHTCAHRADELMNIYSSLSGAVV